MILDHRGRDHLVIQHDCEGRADILGGVIAELACARGIEAEIHRWTAVLVESRLGVGEFFAGHDGRAFEPVEHALVVEGRQNDFTPVIPHLIGRGLSDNGVEGKLRRGADQCLEFRGGADARHLDQDAVGALTLDRRFAGAYLVDPTANDFKRLLDRAVVGGLTLGLGQRDDQFIPLPRDIDIGGSDAGERDHRLGETPGHVDGFGQAFGSGNADAQLVGRRRLAADRADGIARITERVTHFGPERVHPRLVDIGDLNFGQKMRAAAQIETQIDQRGRQEIGPCRRRLDALGGRSQRLDLGHGIVVAFDIGVEQVRYSQNKPRHADKPDQDPLPGIKLQHRGPPFRLRVRSWTEPVRQWP